MNPNQKYFNILGIAPTTNKTVIKKAYRKLAFQYHPDKNSSQEAQSKFIEITDAYEIAIGVKKARGTNVSECNESAEPSKEDRVKAAKERYQKAKQKELEQEALYYLQLVNGKKWEFIKVFGIVSAVFSGLLILDFLLPTNTTTKLIYEMYIEYANSHVYIDIDASTYFFRYEDGMKIMNFPLIEVYKTPIFNDVKFISLIEGSGEKIRIDPFFSLLSIFPLIPIMLMVPLITFFYKRPNPLFSILHMVSVYFIPLVFCFSMLSNWRIFQVFM